jgi:hypothetical protein
VFVLGYALWQAVTGDTSGSFVGPVVACLVVFAVPELIVCMGWLVRRDRLAGPNRRVNDFFLDHPEFAG